MWSYTFYNKRDISYNILIFIRNMFAVNKNIDYESIEKIMLPDDSNDFVCCFCILF